MSGEATSILTELRRRKVYRVVVAYAAVAWAVLEVADLAFPRLGLPEWTVTLVLALAAIGFPIAVVCAWAFELTPDGIKRTPSSESELAAPRNPARILEFVVILGLVAAVGYLYATRLTPGDRTVAAGAGKEKGETQGAGRPSPIVAESGRRADASATRGASLDVETLLRKRSIAVLPFVNMSQDPENEYFSDGISEEILDALANLGKLRVAARTSSFSFKRLNQDIRAIGSQLQVETILEGSVRKAGNRVRITAQLIDAANGYHLWSQTYDRELTDIFSVQDEIARAIVSALHVPLGLSGDDPLVETGTANAEAYSLYLRGLHHFKEIGPANFTKTIDNMQRAIELDPDYAAPYGVLASAHLISALWTPRAVAFPKAKLAFDRALELDPTQGTALVAKAQYLTLTDWNWVEAQKAFEKALLDQSDSTLKTFAYATLYMIPLGKLAEADRLLADAETRDPLDMRIKIVKASLALFRGDTANAIRLYRLAQDIDDRSVQTASALCLAYVEAGDLSSANELLSAWRRRLGFDTPWLLACRSYEAMAQGNMAKAVQYYDEISRAAKKQPGVAFFAGDVALALQRVDEAVGWYGRSLEEGELGLLMTRVRHAKEDKLAAHPGYQAMLARMNLDDASLSEFGIDPPRLRESR